MKHKLTLAGALVAGSLVLTATLPAQRQQPSQEKLIEQRATKLAKPVFKNANWLFDYDKARQAAEKEGKMLFTYFTRSYSR